MKCSVCNKRNSIISPTYTKQSFCKSCFFKIVERRIGKTNRDNKLVKKGDRIAVALSGGKDSTLMLHWLVSLSKKVPDVKIIAINAFRGDAEAVKLLKVCEKICKELKVPLHVAHYSRDAGVTFSEVINITNKLKTNRCTVCGVFRRRLLDSFAKKLKCNKLAVGHNLTDEAQSYLMNFIRGDITTFDHLGPITNSKHLGFVQRIRPLRDVPDEDIKAYVKLKEWTYHPHPCPCRTGSLRFNMLEIMELLRKARPDVDFSLVSAGDKVRVESTKKNAKEELKTCGSCGEVCTKDICRVCQFLKLK